MAPMQVIDRMYGKGRHRLFKEGLRKVYPGVSRHMVHGFDRIPALRVEWSNGARMVLRFDIHSLHIEELVNSSDGKHAEGLYRGLVHESGLPELFTSWGIETITCEPSDKDAERSLSRYDMWEVWYNEGYHPVWVWWTKPRTVEALTSALDLAWGVQDDRRGRG